MELTHFIYTMMNFNDNINKSNWQWINIMTTSMDFWWSWHAESGVFFCYCIVISIVPGLGAKPRVLRIQACWPFLVSRWSWKNTVSSWETSQSPPRPLSMYSNRCRVLWLECVALLARFKRWKEKMSQFLQCKWFMRKINVSDSVWVLVLNSVGYFSYQIFCYHF